MSDEESKGTSLLERLIQVRMVSGKIYGPYKRAEILVFIRKGKIYGEEEILVEGETQWKAISSDVEFFDELQKVLMGVDSGEAESPKKKRKEKLTRTIPLARGVSETNAVQRSVEEDASSATKKSAKKNKETLSPRRIESTSSVASDSHSRAPLARDLGIDVVVGSKPAPIIKKSNSFMLIVLLLLVAGGVFYAFKQKSSSLHSPSKVDFSKFHSSRFYARHLVRELSHLPPLPQIPAQNLRASPLLNLPSGWGVQVWADDMKKLHDEKDAGKKEESSYWLRWVWDLFWSASAARSLDASLAQQMATRASEILEILKKQKIISQDTVSLMDAILLFDEAKWDDVEKLLINNPNYEAKWLRSEAKWIKAWSADASYRADPTDTSKGESEAWSLTSQVRDSFALSPNQLFQAQEQLAQEDPLSYHLWFSAAQFYWKNSTTSVERSMRFFLVGFASLSLYPIPVQEMVWNQFFKYLNVHGRKMLVEKALQNVEIIRSGEVYLSDQNKTWWDLGEEGLDIKTAMDLIYQKVKTSRAELVDLAALSVLGPVAPEGSSYMIEVAYRAAFDKNWDRARQIFDQIVEKEPKNILALGGKVWASASLYQFDDALNTLTKIGQVQGTNGEYDRYHGLVLSVARDYDAAEKILDEHVKKFPTDAWSYYFYASMKENLEKNYECTRNASLARLHAEGELKARSDLLFYRCGIKAGIGVKQALVEIEKLQQDSPNDISIQLEHVDALISSKRMADALAVARNYVEKSPRSYDLRMKLGDVYSLRGDFDRAVAFYNNAVELRPHSADAFIKIGKVMEDLKRLPEAAQNYETAARAQPTFPDVFLLAARAYMKLKNSPKAAEMYVRELQARPSSVTTFIEAAEFFLSVNAATEVPKIYKMLGEDFQQDPRVLTRLAQAYVGLGNFELARLNAANALVGDPKMPEPHRILGDAFEALGNYDASKLQYDLYIRLLPAAPDADQLRRKISQPPFPQ